MGIHNCSKIVQQNYDNIQNSDKISKENKEDIKDFLRYMEDKELSDSRKMRYLQSAKQILEHNDFRLKGADEEQIREIHRQIQDSAYYSKEYSPETKKEYKKLIRIYFKWENGGREVPEKASFFSLTVRESVKDRTRPQDLPKPVDIKFLCQNLSLRDRAILLTHWDLGARIGETLSTKVSDYYEEDGAKYIHVRGNKSSPNREARVVVAPPAIDRWLEEGHPAPEEDDAYLFCQKETKDDSDTEAAYKTASYRYFASELKRARKDAGLDCEAKTHSVRKARVSFLKALGVPESSVDKRVGHVVGSDVTREYTRLSDSDSNRAYAQGYGEEENGDELEDDLIPLKCVECGSENPGYRDRCDDCNGLLEIQEVKGTKNNERKAKELLWETMKEKGMMEEVLDKMN
jgi:integrase/recombinase XerD